ncbi:crossover junction endodeoxyribonuclease RuvC [uncultured Methanospirillum sp.]|uniref:crossover junction endodeoxyribonuclease RuvC n=1 Tax=uncultured Methanospirillum sp. TaxID=262503 RepID=UPI0029C6DD2A|nr:crossover junction endodeoxyribonuclease RuvC [uncultured Methanospirillum sp.]
MVTVLGIDPGYATMGYGIISDDRQTPGADEWGCVKTSKSDGDSPIRLGLIYKGVVDLIERFSPESMAIERLFFARNTTSALQVSEARGVIILAAVHHDIPVTEYTPNQVKVAITGSGSADKRQMQEMITRLLRLPEIPRPDDAADGLSLALCHINCSRGRR